MSERWVGVDWGTTNLRAWVLDESNEPVASVSSDQGAASLVGDQFESVLLSLLGEHLPSDQSVDVYCCGMVGSRQGWVEASYRMTPAGLLPDTPDMTTFDAADGRLRIHIVPGVAQDSPPDVMRGEETQVAGCLESSSFSDAVYCLPGTHSKWVQADREGISHFKTFPTGELFALLSQQSILRHSMGEASVSGDTQVFLDAVHQATEKPGQFLSELFPMRAADLLGQNAQPAAREYLSGLLIGLELANARDLFSGLPVTLIGADALAERYRLALESLDVTAKTVDGGACVRAGLIATRQHAGGNRS